ncbi:hypothetical protein AK830_g1671 [Neonectria ditissima]|uniref:Uncharacterized protein n=1 Tax=Neonectria ditissima TaxID=78410 RepID=A0A0N8H8L3_9HYPO|nr:hypothetical protein AK830_g1671 [Neonectria ditissima]
MRIFRLRPEERSLASKSFLHPGRHGFERVRALPTPAVSFSLPFPLPSRCTWVAIEEENISHWNDFTFQNIFNAFGDILDRSVVSDYSAEGIDPVHVRFSSDIRALGVSHFFPLLRSPISEGSRVLGERLGCVFQAVDAGEEQTVRSRGRNLRCSLSFHFNQMGQTYLVASGVRGSRSWHSDDLVNMVPFSTAPISQVATYSEAYRTRYTFMLTDEEVVVARVFYGDDGKYRVEWKAIPWSASGDNTLTVSLAIWTLVMMSLNDNYRRVRHRRNTPPLNLWWRYHNPAGDVYYQHHLSMRRRSNLPSGAVCRDGPST